MANMSAFQANDASSILAARTKIKYRHRTVFYFGLAGRDRTRLLQSKREFGVVNEAQKRTKYFSAQMNGGAKRSGAMSRRPTLSRQSYPYKVY